MTAPLLEISAISMKYGALRPLRLEQLSLAAGDHVAIVGLDQPAAEVLINLVTGAALPDAGSVRVFGRLTADITDSDDWLTTVDRFGIVSERAALLEPMSVIQNLAVPFSLELDPIPDNVERDVRQLAIEVGLSEADLTRAVAGLGAAAKVRVRLARAIALAPRVLLAEHPNATLAAEEVPAFAADLARITNARRLASVTLTADRTFAKSVAEQVLTLQPATGEWKAAAGWRRWFGGA